MLADLETRDGRVDEIMTDKSIVKKKYIIL